jgi:peptidoglycan-associated lipoprotein
MNKRWIVGMSLLCVALLSCGCPPKRGDSDGADVLNPDVLDEEVMDPRWEIDDANRIHDVAFDSVGFRYDNYQIEMDEAAKIEAVADFMKDEGGSRVVTEGHCDERGSREYNLALGEHRAQAVRAYLISLGVEGERIQTRSYGEEHPRSSEHNESAWRENRRVEFSLYRQ